MCAGNITFMGLTENGQFFSLSNRQCLFHEQKLSVDCPKYNNKKIF